VRTAFPKPPIASCTRLPSAQKSRQDGQTQPPRTCRQPQPSTSLQSHKRSPGGDVGSGAGDIGKESREGHLAAAKGVAKVQRPGHASPLDAAAIRRALHRRQTSPRRCQGTAKLPRAQAGALANYSTSTRDGNASCEDPKIGMSRSRRGNSPSV